MTAEITLRGAVRADATISFAGVNRLLADARAGGARAVLVTLDSRVGGHAPEAFRVHAALRNFARNGRVVVHVPDGGQAVSAASVVALAGDYIVADPSASYLIHKATGGDSSIANSASVATARPASLYAERTTLGSLDALHGLLESCGDTWLSAWDALGHGFVDEIGDAGRARYVAHALAWRWPSWPENLQSSRHSVLEVRASLAKRVG